MDEITQKFLRDVGPVLCLDIGSGTQDALLARPGLECENWPRFVLPSPARLAAQRIRELTLLKRPVWLYGGNMGGGFTQAVREHLAAGLPVASTAAATRGIHDNEDVVRGMGVTVCSQCPEKSVPVCLSDYAQISGQICCGCPACPCRIWCWARPRITASTHRATGRGGCASGRKSLLLLPVRQSGFTLFPPYR